MRDSPKLIAELFPFGRRLQMLRVLSRFVGIAQIDRGGRTVCASFVISMSVTSIVPKAQGPFAKSFVTWDNDTGFTELAMVAHGVCCEHQFVSPTSQIEQEKFEVETQVQLSPY
jgi:hypothetical protein